MNGTRSAKIARARELRRNATPEETKLWRAVRETFPAAHFRRQPPLGPFYPDFCSHKAKLIVELDGGHHYEAALKDAKRKVWLNSQGYRVLRFWNNDVVANLSGVLETIAAKLPSPLVGEGGPAKPGRMRGNGKP